MKGKIYAINALYRPSTQTSTEDYNTFLTAADEILTNLDRHTAHNQIFLSDMNFGNSYCKNPILLPKPLTDTAPELFQSFGYSQMIDIPTRITNTCTSLLDLIFVHNIDNVRSHGTIGKIADHEGIFITFHCTQDKPKERLRTIYDYDKIDEDGLINYIKNIDFDTLVFSQP